MIKKNPHHFLECLLALYVGHRLCINFSVSRANFLTTLPSHLNVTCSCYFRPIYLMWALTIVLYIVNYSYFGNC